MKKAIFYEGDYDRDVLNHVIAELPNAPILVRANSKYGMKSFIQGHLGASTAQKLTDDDALAFRDRDFDFPVPETCSLIIPRDGQGRVDNKIRSSYRTTIENYLLTPETFWAFCQEKDIYHEQFAEISAVQGLFQQAADEILCYQAARHALGAIRITAVQETGLTSGSGTLPNSLTESGCQEQCHAKIRQYGESLQNYSIAAFEEQYQAFLRLFRGLAFREQSLFLVYFHGKDLQASINRHLPGFPFKSLYKYALAHFSYTQFPDLAELRTLIDPNAK